jgi:hypothetical protein
MKHVLDSTDYVFCTKKCFALDENSIKLNPLATLLESEEKADLAIHALKELSK